jgi:predicted permease
VRLVSLLVVSERRAEWRAEWEGELFELWHRAERTPGRYPRPRLQLLQFSLGAIAHAFAELRQEWNAELLGYELRHTLRFLVRNRVFSLTAALLIALGVGANTTVFTIVNAVMLRAPRGIAAPDRLAQMGRGGTDARDFDSWSYPVFADFRAHNTVFTDLAAFDTREVTLGRGDDVAPATAQLVSANYFRVLGARLARGRGFVDEEEREGGPAVVVISDLTWRRRFAADPDVVGKSLTIRGRDFQIIGIAAPDFTGADVGSGRPDLWVPLGATSIVAGGMERLNSRFVSWLWIAGRLKPGVDARAAQAAMRPLFRQMQLDASGEVRDDLLVVAGLGLRPADRALANVICAALLAIVAAVLLIACANLAALLLARGAARESEIGVRLALGASRRRIVRQLVMETAVIAVAGSVTAFAFTRWTARFVEWLMPYPIAVSMQPDARVLAFAIVVGVWTSAVFGLVPAMRTARVDLLTLLRAGGGAVGATFDRGRIRAALLVGQIALSFVLLGGTGLLLRTVRHASTADPGFRTHDVLVGDIDLRTGLESSQRALAGRLEEVAARAALVPGVTGVALASDVPATGTMSNRTMWRADGDPSSQRMPPVSVLVVDTAYFHVMGVPIVRGRQFDTVRDPAGAMTSIVINETLARRLWPGEDAIGKEIALGSIAGERRAPVVGIARDTRNRSLRSEPGPQAYFLLSQNPNGRALLHVAVAPGRQRIDASIVAALRPLMVGAPAPRFVSVRDRLSRSLADIRLIGILGATFGALALALAAAGIYGVVSYETARRRREYGVRLALGASPWQIHGMVLRQTARFAGLGILIGVLGTAGVSPLLKRWIFGISPFDPLTFASVVGVLCLTTVVAALGPATRASRSDPMTSLRSE